MEEQEGDDVVVGEEEGVTYGELREAIRAYDMVGVLTEGWTEDQEYWKGKVDEANRWTFIGVASAVILLVIDVVLVFK